MRLLDVGCGWGSMLLHAAGEHGVSAVGVTLSRAQAELARERVAEEGLGDRVEVRVADYRELRDKTFDAVSSIGMFEHVGRAQLGRYFRHLHGLLRPGGRLLNHGISPPPGQRPGSRGAASSTATSSPTASCTRSARSSRPCSGQASRRATSRACASTTGSRSAAGGCRSDRLVAAILRGEKTSTSTLIADYEADGDPLPEVGKRYAVVDSKGLLVAVIETTELRVILLREVDLAFALEEGEGFLSVEGWREAHERFWASFLPHVRVDDETTLVAERFRLVEVLQQQV